MLIADIIINIIIGFVILRIASDLILLMIKNKTISPFIEIGRDRFRVPQVAIISGLIYFTLAGILHLHIALIHIVSFIGMINIPLF